MVKVVTYKDIKDRLPNLGEPNGEAELDAARIVACVNACAGIPTEQLGDVKALVQSVTGHESPQLWRIEWLASLLQSYEEGGLDQLAAERKEDPEAFLTLLIELQELVSLTRAALAPFRKD